MNTHDKVKYLEEKVKYLEEKVNKLSKQIAPLYDLAVVNAITKEYLEQIELIKNKMYVNIKEVQHHNDNSNKEIKILVDIFKNISK